MLFISEAYLILYFLKMMFVRMNKMTYLQVMCNGIATDDARNMYDMNDNVVPSNYMSVC